MLEREVRFLALPPYTQSGVAPATCIAGYWQRRVHALNHGAPYSPAQLAELPYQKSFFFTLRLADLPVQEIDLRFIGRCLRRRVALEDSPQHPAVAFFQLWPRAIIACNRAWIRFECTSKCIANRAMVRSPLIAATTTFALAPRSASFVSASCPAPALSAFSRGRAPP
jgi:hypothetical protein